MSSLRAHVDWLKLVEVTGPFLSLEVLGEAFPQGPDRFSPEKRAALHDAHRLFADSESRTVATRAWVDAVLEVALEIRAEDVAEGAAIPANLTTRLPEHGVTLRPDAVVFGTGTDEERRPELFVVVLPEARALDRRHTKDHWDASPIARATALCHGAKVPMALVTNGPEWALVHARPGETTSTCTWQAERWFDERPSLEAFHSLLNHRRLCGVTADRTLRALLERSADSHHEVTDQLGRQVREAVEILVQTLDRIDRKTEGKLLDGIDERRLYEGAVTVMMRLVFLLAAEERGLLLLGDPVYDGHYAASTLREQLQEVADRQGEDLLLRRHDAWSRLLATFRAVYAGVQHENLRLPAYGGSLFDPDRFPFLEGRSRESSWLEESARPLAIDNRTVLHLLNALQLLQVHVRGLGSETRRLSFEALDVEQIGHVYEGLLDHEARRAVGPVIGITGTGGAEPEVSLIELENLLDQSRDRLVNHLGQVSGRGRGAAAKRTIERALDYSIEAEMQASLSAVCEGYDDLYERVAPWAGLLRESTYGEPVVYPSGALYVTDSQDRRASGSHYTPRSLTESIVQHALDPLVYEGFSDGAEPTLERLRPPRDLLALRVCDLAMGSGAFLVQACRYLSEKLIEAWRIQAEMLASQAPETGPHARLQVTPHGDLTRAKTEERILPTDPDERLVLARRLVAERCLYGVDINAMAVEMAKLSLWITTLQKDRPFTFVDHALRCGDSLLGVVSTEQLERLHLQPDSPGARQRYFTRDLIEEALAKAAKERRDLEATTVADARDAEIQAQRLQKAEGAVADLSLVADALVGAHLSACCRTGRPRATRLDRCRADLDTLVRTISGSPDDGTPSLFEDSEFDRASAHSLSQEWLAEGREEGQPARVTFHWLLEFPEVFGRGVERPGFDALVGNPPFAGGQKLTGLFGRDYREFLVQQLGHGARGSADYVAYMYLRAGALLREGGNLGLIATNTLAQGDTREVGLDQMTARGFHIYRAIRSRPWPTGGAALEVAYTWIHKGEWRDGHHLEDEPATGITSYLVVPGNVAGNPHRLEENQGKAFQGSIVLGMGFILTPDEAQALITKDENNRKVLFPYLNGQDLNSRPDQSPSRWVINFHDWPLDRESAPADYDGPVASDYPDCLSIVSENVKPERERNRYSRSAREKWWLFERSRPELYSAISGLDRVIGVALTSKFLSWSWVRTPVVASNMTAIAATSDPAWLGSLQSTLHQSWTSRYQSSLETRGRYTPSDCFETYPQPERIHTIRKPGERFAELRSSQLIDGAIGLTTWTNGFHNASSAIPGIRNARDLFIEMDHQVLRAYGWDDLDPTFGFVSTPHGTRFTWDQHSLDEVLQRLLALNHSRHEREQASE